MDPWFLTSIILLSVSVLGILFCKINQDNYTWAPLLGFILTPIMILSIFGILYFTGAIGSYSEKILRKNETKYSSSRGAVLGKYLVENYPDRKALIVTEFDYMNNLSQKQLVETLKQILEPKIKIQAIDTLDINKWAFEDGKVPILRKLMSVFEFDNLLSKHKDCDLIISLIGLPDDMKDLEIWSRRPPPVVALLNGDIKYIAKAIRRKRIVAAIIYKPNLKINREAPPDDSLKTFNERFIMITPDNIDEVIKNKEYSKLFK
jgi:hypothetical protein